MSNKELRKKLESCREDVVELKEEITECKLAKVRRQNKDLQRRLNALEQRDPRATANLRMRRAENNDPPSRRAARAVRAVRAVRARRIPQAQLEMKDDNPPEVPQRRRLFEDDVGVNPPPPRASVPPARLSRFRAPPEQQDQQWRREQAARIDQNQRRRRERQRIMRRNNQPWEEDPDSTDQDREQRRQQLRKMEQKRQQRMQNSDRELQRSAAKRKERVRIRNLPPVELPNKQGWWAQMFEGENALSGTVTGRGRNGKKYRQLPVQDWNVLYIEQDRRRIDARRKKNNYNTLRF